MLARYRNRAGLAGINEILLRWNARGRVRVKVAGRRGCLALGEAALPLLWQLDLDPAVTATLQCAETGFGVGPEKPSCSVKRAGAVVSCSHSRRRGGRARG